MAQYIYTMNRVTKVVPPKREILKDISLSFFPGAKIGVLGLNGSGKSSLLRIMAGIDDDFQGEARPQTGIRVGYLQQEPVLDETKDVRGNVEDGIAEVKALLARFDEISNRFAEPMDDAEMQALMEEQGTLQDAIEAAGGWEIDRKLEIAADALRLPPWEADVSRLSGGERRRLAIAQILTQAPDLYLLDEPTNHLDPQHQLDALRLFRERADGGAAVVASLHDVNLAVRFADRCLLLYGDGRWDLGATTAILDSDRLSQLYSTPMETVTWRNRELFVASGDVAL